jgi:hypothetical protein
VPYKQQDLFLTVLEAEKSNFEALLDSVFGEGLLPGSEIALSPCDLTW